MIEPVKILTFPVDSLKVNSHFFSLKIGLQAVHGLVSPREQV